MTEEEILNGLRIRRLESSGRIDMTTIPVPPLFPAVTLETVAAAEREFGCEIPPFLKRLYSEVGNGGFGPGAGLIGLNGGYPDADGRCLIEKYRHLRLHGWREGLLPLFDWGGGAWSCVNAADHRQAIVTSDESGYTVTHFSLASWFVEWLRGVDLNREIFEIGDATIMNPFTHKPVVAKRRVRAKGSVME